MNKPVNKIFPLPLTEQWYLPADTGEKTMIAYDFSMESCYKINSESDKMCELFMQ